MRDRFIEREAYREEPDYPCQGTTAALTVFVCLVLAGIGLMLVIVRFR